jgi:GMP synthase-like glutamine amidotransferase
VANRDGHGLILQHGTDGPPAILEDWLRERAIAHRVHATWRHSLPPDPGEFAWIASLGSEHTPGHPDAPAWVNDEVAWLARALEAEVPVLGLCFGGQALALAAGGEVVAAEPAEVGWMEIETSEPDLIPAGPWLHYHYDQLVMPPGGRELARSAAGTTAFELGPSLGLQFHPESTPEIAAAWERQDVRRQASPGWDPAALAAQGERARAIAERSAHRLFDAWWERMGTLSRGSGAAGKRRPERRIA